MSAADGRPGLSDEARFEMAMAAGGHERRNRPAALVLLSILVLAVAGVAAGWGMTTRAAAKAKLRQALADETRVEELAADVKRLTEQEQQLPGNVGRAVTNLLSELEGMAIRAGMKERPRPPQPSVTTRGGLTITEYDYSEVKDASLSALLEWLRSATNQIAGLEVFSLRLRPDGNNWSMSVTFRRWERAQ